MQAKAAVVWDESVNGSLSTDYLNPTGLGVLASGSNHIIGSTSYGQSNFFTFTIGEGIELETLVVESWDSLDDVGFIAVGNGTVLPTDPSNPDVTALLGYEHYGQPHVGLDILQLMGAGPGSQGFLGSLGDGEYVFWVQQNGVQADWDLSFNVIPEPGTGAFVVASLAVVLSKGGGPRNMSRRFG